MLSQSNPYLKTVSGCEFWSLLTQNRALQLPDTAFLPSALSPFCYLFSTVNIDRYNILYGESEFVSRC